MVGKRISLVRSLTGVLVLCSISLAAGLVGCGGSAPTTITIQGPASSHVDPGDSATFTATVANDSNSAGVTWTLTGTDARVRRVVRTRVPRPARRLRLRRRQTTALPQTRWLR